MTSGGLTCATRVHGGNGAEETRHMRLQGRNHGHFPPNLVKTINLCTQEAQSALIMRKPHKGTDQGRGKQIAQNQRWAERSFHDTLYTEEQ